MPSMWREGSEERVEMLECCFFSHKSENRVFKRGKVLLGLSSSVISKGWVVDNGPFLCRIKSVLAPRR